MSEITIFSTTTARSASPGVVRWLRARSMAGRGSVGFARQVVLTYAVRIFLIPVGLLYAAITARWLGPEGLGVFAAIGAILGIVSQFGNLGLSIAAVDSSVARLCRSA